MEENRNKDYRGKDPMSPEKITSHEPTAVDRDEDIEIVEEGQTGTAFPEAEEKYERKGMTKIEEEDENESFDRQ